MAMMMMQLRNIMETIYPASKVQLVIAPFVYLEKYEIGEIKTKIRLPLQN